MLVRLSAAEGAGRRGRARVGGGIGHAHSWSARRDMCRWIHAFRGTYLPGHAQSPRSLRGTCPVLVTSNGHNANMPIPGPRRGTCPALVPSNGHNANMPVPGLGRGTCPAGFEPWKGHVQCWSARPDMCRRIYTFRGTCGPGRAQRPRSLRGTCPVLVPSNGHSANMPIPGPRRGTCPAGFEPCKGHVQGWPPARGMSRGF
jgi:hypothetical protein